MPSTQTVVKITERRKSVTKVSKIDVHPMRDRIIRDLVDGVKSQGAIAKEYGLTQVCVSRYWTTNLKAALAPKRESRTKEAIQVKVSKAEERRQIREEVYHDSLMDMLNESKSNLEAFKTQGNLAAVESILCGSRTNALKFLEKALETDQSRNMAKTAPPSINIFGKYIALPHGGNSIEYEDTEGEVIEGELEEEEPLQIASSD